MISLMYVTKTKQKSLNIFEIMFQTKKYNLFAS